MHVNYWDELVARGCEAHDADAFLVNGRPIVIRGDHDLRHLRLSAADLNTCIEDGRWSQNGPFLRSMFVTGAGKGVPCRVDLVGDPAMGAFVTRMLEGTNLPPYRAIDTELPQPTMYEMLMSLEAKDHCYGVGLFEGCPPLVWTTRGVIPLRTENLSAQSIGDCVKLERNRSKFMANPDDGTLGTDMFSPAGTRFNLQVYEGNLLIALLVKVGEDNSKT